MRIHTRYYTTLKLTEEPYLCVESFSRKRKVFEVTSGKCNENVKIGICIMIPYLYAWIREIASERIETYFECVVDCFIKLDST